MFMFISTQKQENPNHYRSTYLIIKYFNRKTNYQIWILIKNYKTGYRSDLIVTYKKWH